jgi:hypothetical protein
MGESGWWDVREAVTALRLGTVQLCRFSRDFFTRAIEGDFKAYFASAQPAVQGVEQTLFVSVGLSNNPGKPPKLENFSSRSTLHASHAVCLALAGWPCPKQVRRNGAAGAGAGASYATHGHLATTGYGSTLLLPQKYCICTLVLPTRLAWAFT